MNDVSYTVLKLTNGDDIICEVDYERYDSEASLSQRVFEIQNPLLMVATRRVEDDGVREGLSLSRWVEPFTEQKYFSIPATSVITSAEASPGLVKYYEYVLNRMEHYFDEGSLPTDEDLDEIELEEDEEFLELEGPSNKIH
jgi:hypothetical protein|tara:strand:- start:394 stop:816 length:423 start_codon:yes stop_codon:yes gene_type:complete